MTAGLLAKTALFPMHFWLPPAHAGAPAAASAVLSALVVKASYFLIVRIWFDVLPGPRSVAAAQMLGTLGAAAIIFGSVIALQQARLKLLIAYSTVAQIGYLFLMFPLVVGFDAQPWGDAAWTGGLIQLFSHAFAKAAMFMAAGLIAEAARPRPHRRLGRHRPGAADDGLRVRHRWDFADGRAAERRLRREMAAAHRKCRRGAVVVGGRHHNRRPARRRLRVPGFDPNDCLSAQSFAAFERLSPS